MSVQQMLSGATSDPDKELEQVGKNVMESLGMMYKVCHRIDSSGQACQAVQQIMQAVSEVVNNVESMSGGDVPVPPTDPFQAASQNVGSTMQADAAQGQPQGGPSLY